MGNEKSGSWSPGRPEWLITTLIALTGAVTGGISLFMNFFYHPPEPPITVESDRAKFSALSYSEQLDQCAPYIKTHLQEWFALWQNDLAEFNTRTGSNSSVPTTYSQPDDTNANPQDIINSVVAIANYAQKHASASVGGNLLTCIYSQGWQHVADKSELFGFFTTVVGSGNAEPLQMPVVTRSSPVYYAGSFDGYRAGARPNIVIETKLANEGSQSDFVSQEGFTMADGTLEGVKMWVSFTNVYPDDEDWVQSLEVFQGR